MVVHVTLDHGIEVRSLTGQPMAGGEMVSCEALNLKAKVRFLLGQPNTVGVVQWLGREVVALDTAVQFRSLTPSPCSLTDKVRGYGPCDAGSIPARGAMPV